MARGERTRHLAVCMLSPHPGLLEGMQSLLSSTGLKLSLLRLEPGPGFDLERLDIPQASVYVVDASSEGPAIERLIEAIRQRDPKAPLLVMIESAKDDRTFPYLQAGAKGVVRFADIRTDLARAIKLVAAGGFWIPRTQLARFVDSIVSESPHVTALKDPGHLSRREREVLMTILQGLSNKEIGTKLNISERTVKFHVSNLLAKFGVQRRSDLILKHYRIWPTSS